MFANNGFHVYLFDDIRPTPELSFAIRHYHCHAGVMVTASHNPKEYNGYKAYWQDGAQLTAPHDTAVIDEVNRISDPSMVRFGEDGAARIQMMGEETDKVYLRGPSPGHQAGLHPSARYRSASGAAGFEADRVY